VKFEWTSTSRYHADLIESIWFRMQVEHLVRQRYRVDDGR
jgi:hypothetical protein